MTVETADFTSGEIGKVAKELAEPSASASPAEAPPAKTEPSPAVAIVQPVTPEKKQDDEFGAVPYERHKAILDTTRHTLESQLERLSWAQPYDRSKIEEALRLAEMVERKDPRLLERFKTEQSAMPQPDSRSAETGELFYSPEAAEKLADWKAEQRLAKRLSEIDARIAPFETEHAERERVNGHVSAIVEASKWEGFDQHLDLINAEVKSARAAGNKLPSDQLLREVYIRHVVPKLAILSSERLAEEKKKWAADLNKTTAETSTEVNPGRTPASSRKKDSEMSISELYADEVAKRRAS